MNKKMRFLNWKYCIENGIMLDRTDYISYIDNVINSIEIKQLVNNFNMHDSTIYYLSSDDRNINLSVNCRSYNNTDATIQIQFNEVGDADEYINSTKNAGKHTALNVLDIEFLKLENRYLINILLFDYDIIQFSFIGMKLKIKT